MIKITATYDYDCETKEQADAVIARLPEGTDYKYNVLTHEVIYKVVQEVANLDQL